MNDTVYKCESFLTCVAVQGQERRQGPALQLESHLHVLAWNGQER